MFNNGGMPIYMQRYYAQKMGVNTSKQEPELTEKEKRELKFKNKLNDIKMSEDVKKKPATPKELNIDDYIELLKEEGNRSKYIELLEALKDD